MSDKLADFFKLGVLGAVLSLFIYIGLGNKIDLLDQKVAIIEERFNGFEKRFDTVEKLLEELVDKRTANHYE